ncbi:carbohydrate-binding domain-containing protein [Paraflavisolibacter sp. H34]|uniref:carbohydrate-binding domain-containing protein n=1 Tax=Huijunlia imazamoxiresistens TaxID=3127457 RepID=UPI003018DD6C
MPFHRSLPALLLAALASAAVLSCRKDADSLSDEDVATEESIITNSRDTSFTNAVVIRYTDSSVAVTNPFKDAGISVAVSSRDVVVTSHLTGQEINYVLSGTAANGSFKLYSDAAFGLVLNGLDLINTNGPALNIQSTKNAAVTVLGGTNNRLVDGSSYASSSEDQKAAFFSEGQLTFSGTGTLAVKGKNKHALCSDESIYLKEGNITVSGAASDGIHVNKYFKMDGGQLAVTSSSDGIESEEGYVSLAGGGLTVNSVDDGIVASYEGSDATITPYVSITGGQLHITTTGDKGNAIKSENYTTVNSSDSIVLSVSGKGAKGFKTGGNLTLANGKIRITTTGSAFYDTEDKDIAAPAGINCDGAFVMQEGSVVITSSGAGGRGIWADGTLAVNGGTINVTTTGSKFTYGSASSEAKGIKADGALTLNGGSVTVSSADDGLKSETSVTLNGGSLAVTKSYEGVEAPKITVNNGTASIVSSDDSFNTTNGNGGESNDGSLLTIAGGTIFLNSTGGDPMDSNGSIAQTGGLVVVQGPSSSPEVAIDYNGTYAISGGQLIASGPSGNMIQATSSSSAQYTLLVKLSSSVSAGTLFNLQDASGNTLVTYAPARNATYFVFSSPALQSGATYKVSTGGSYSGATATNGYYSGGTYTGGTQRGSATVSSKVTTVNL